MHTLHIILTLTGTVGEYYDLELERIYFHVFEINKKLGGVDINITSNFVETDEIIFLKRKNNRGRMINRQRYVAYITNSENALLF